MDITMPNMTGIESLKQILSLDPTAKVIMCTAVGQKSNEFECIKRGAVDFIVKPFKPDRVLDAIKKVSVG